MNSFKVSIALALIAVAAAGLIEPHHYAVKVVHKHQPIKEHHHEHHFVAPVEHHGHHYEAPVEHHDDHKDYFAYPKYKFEYGVKDPHTHDHKSQWETRDGDVVKGEYTLDEADGTKRVVSYHASDKTGFEAVVKKIGHAHHPEHYKHHEESHHGYY